MISLETVCRHLLDIAPVNWLIPNQEWTKRHDLDLISRAFSKILCKTREGERIFKGYFPDKTHYVGFLARDVFNPQIIRKKRFLHVGGNSSFRGTQEVLDAWKWRKDGTRIDAELLIVSKALKERPEIPNVKYFDWLSEEELHTLQNECLFHLYPSGTEGFGHAIREAMSVNAVVLTTAAPPMDEIKTASKVPERGWTTYNLAKVYEVSALDIHVACKELLNMYSGTEALGEGWKLVNYHGENATREEFLRGNEFFETAFAEHLEDFVPKSAKMAGASVRGKMRISFLGNFAAQESTENMILWALEQGLDHAVDRIQENEATLRKIDLSVRNADLFIWVRTPGWLKIEDKEMMTWVADQKNTAGIHLDKFWGIPDREALIGQIPFWKLNHVFTADGSRDEDFKKRGVNHHWMEPAVSEVYIHPGTPRDEYICDVGFVGAKDYHNEYPFRREMVEYLERMYGNRFKHITGIRGHLLNDVYASMKIVVGDCIFAGTPRYWSDRVPETIGRHGFLLHPEVEGLDLPIPTYMPQDLRSLKEQIDLWLFNEGARREVIYEGVEQIRRDDTWTVRMRQIIETVTA
jgi:glycosyltransferase involved in cell wall biosynthesis